MKHHATLAQTLAHIPGKASDKWRDGERFAAALAHGTMSVELYAPVAHDPQEPHAQDELYVIVVGSGLFELNGVDIRFSVGDVLFVPAGAVHRFKQFSDDFKTWVIFYGTQGGELDNDLTKLV